MINHWTVVGFYPETGGVYVEHVAGNNMDVIGAVDQALEILPEREVNAVVVSVFRGHLDDEFGDLGLGTKEPPVVRHPYQPSIPPHYPDDPEGKCLKCREA